MTGGMTGMAGMTGSNTAGDDDPWAGMPPLELQVTVHRCSACHMAFVQRSHCARHVQLPACHGATIKTKTTVVTGMGDSSTHVRQTRQSAGRSAVVQNATTIHHADTVNVDNRTTINIIVGDKLGDLVRSGTVTESELIRRTVLENADLRRQLRTLENIPAAMFRVTKGKDGPQQLRNARLDGRRVTELQPSGAVQSTTLQYCKDTAVRMVERLQAAIASVDASSPLAVREWARDVEKALAEKAFGKYDYPTVLALYRDASTAFYKLPQDARDRVSDGVSNIALFIARDAGF